MVLLVYLRGKKIGRKKNLEILEKAIKKAERDENKLSTEFYNIKTTIDNLKAELNTNQIQQERSVLSQIIQEKVSLLTRLENFESFLKEVDDKRGGLSEQITTLKASNNEIEAQLKDKNLLVAKAKEKIMNTDGSFRQVAEQLSKASTTYNEKNIEFIRQQNKVTSFQRELNFRQKQWEETKAALENDEKSIGRSDDEVAGINDDIEQLQEELHKAYDLRKEKESSLTEAEQTYFQGRGGINEIENALRKFNKTRQDAQILVNSLKDKFSEVKFEISSIAQRLRIEFEIDINDVINQAPETKLQEDELQIKVERLKNRLDNYGEINPMAVEAYDEMNERYVNISTQRDDIVQAKASLVQTIKEIEETATTQFIDAFDKARLYFIDVFRSLFTEDDNCDLVLLDPENPLESKIEIVARPKGKRPQTISQLSGGEKTLTATALLFALYLLKPAPFCIFDEVDAPLDDANINKFNKIIKKFSKDSQFIIVTHNKLTMAAVDTIYGVYMAEQGVSGVSAVDFRDFEHSSTFEISQN